MGCLWVTARAVFVILRLPSILRRSSNSSDDAIISIEISGVIASWNRSAERLFGYTAEEAIGNPITIIVPDDRPEEEPFILARIRRGERVDHYETVRQRKDGTRIDISLSVSPIRNAKGRIVGASKIARDINRRKRTQEQQQILLREMNHRVRNLFAVASSVVALSAASATTTEELASAVQGRLAALARAHALTLSMPFGMAQSDCPTSLHQLIRTSAGAVRPRNRGSGFCERTRCSTLCRRAHKLCAASARVRDQCVKVRRALDRFRLYRYRLFGER